MSDPQLQVVIACHSPARQLTRAVTSVVRDNPGVAAVTVVAHNVGADTLAATLPPGLANRVHWLELHDGIRSPSGPFNMGLDNAATPWVSFLGSDDYLQPGAVSTWLSAATHVGAGNTPDAVLTRLFHQDGRTVLTPPTRPVRRKVANAVRDRLYYRSAPLGALRVDTLRHRGLRLEPRMPTGGDLRLSASLYTWGRVSVQRGGPGYVIGADASDRVTMSAQPLREQLAHVFSAWGPSGWAAALPPQNRLALATKYLRIHIFGAAYYRALGDVWPGDDPEVMAQAVNAVLHVCPDSAAPLSQADQKLLQLLTDPHAPPERVNAAAIARRRLTNPRVYVPGQLRFLPNREAPPRFMAASALAAFPKSKGLKSKGSACAC